MVKLSPEDFRQQLLSNESGRQYLSLIEEITVKDRTLEAEPGFEIHHVQPRALGGDLFAETNLRKVSTFEHCLLHVLLAKSFQLPETLYPIVRMSFSQFKSCSELEQVTLEDIYEWSKQREKAYGLASGRTFSEESRKKMSDSHKGLPGSTIGRVRIHKGREGKIVKISELEQYLANGWEMGVPERTAEYRKNLSEACKRRPRPSEASKQKNREAHLGKPGGNKGRIFIHKGDTLKRIDPSELETYLADGWEKGHDPSWYQNKPKCRHDTEWKAKVIKANKGRICLNKDGRVKRVFEKDFPKYAEEGWVKGGLSFKRKSQDDSLN